MVNGHPLYTTNVRAEAEAEMANATIAERVFILSTVCEGEFESSKLTSSAVDDALLYLLGGIFGLRKMRCQYKNSRPKCPCGNGSRETQKLISKASSSKAVYDTGRTQAEADLRHATCNVQHIRMTCPATRTEGPLHVADTHCELPWLAVRRCDQSGEIAT